MGDELAAYRAELRAVEDGWYSRCKGERAIGLSPWDAHAAKREEIDRRYGVSPDDPRVYSITAYLRERGEIEAEWNAPCSAKGWEGAKEGTPEFKDWWVSHLRFQARLDDCMARHFPGLSRRAIDTLPKLWAYVTHHLLASSEIVAHIYQKPADYRPPTCNREVQTAYSLLHRLKVPWAEKPPYPSFTQQEAVDELTRIANRLESEDAARCDGTPVARRNRRQPSRAEKAKRTEARDQWVYEQCCRGVAYDTIARRLTKKNPKWQAITTKQGILDCARRYAERHGMPPPPPRQSRG